MSNIKLNLMGMTHFYSVMAKEKHPDVLGEDSRTLRSDLGSDLGIDLGINHEFDPKNDLRISLA